MANPNIVNVANIYGKTVVVNPTTSYASVVANAVASGKIYKINTVLIANISGAVEEVNVKVVRSASDYSLATAMAVPVGSSLVLVSKEISFLVLIHTLYHQITYPLSIYTYQAKGIGHL